MQAGMHKPKVCKFLNVLDKIRANRTGNGLDKAKIKPGECRGSRLARRLYGIAGCKQQPARFFQEHDARRRKRDGPDVPVEKLNAERQFQIGDHLADSRLGEPHAARRGTHAAIFRNLNKNIERTQIEIERIAMMPLRGQTVPLIIFQSTNSV
jgi:hypothetical protein